MSISYKDAGVDIEAGNRAVDLIRKSASSTFTPAVLAGLGSFGAFYDLSLVTEKFRNPVLVQSVDGVGTKTIIANQADDFSRIGYDLVSACSNDIAVHGAVPLTMLDYIANDRLDPVRVAEIVESIAAGCREIGASLIGGETAEMPGTYLPGEHDLVGIITGVVERDSIINGKDICPGDTILGLGSSGLHTNGFSLARAVIRQSGLSLGNIVKLEDGSSAGEPLSELLLKAHVNYTKGILQVLDDGIRIKGMAHITGGGLLENVPRILPEDCDAHIDCSTWEQPLIFRFLQEQGRIQPMEMYRTFNMGIGLVMILDTDDVPGIIRKVGSRFPVPCIEIGKVKEGTGRTQLFLPGGEVLA